MTQADRLNRSRRRVLGGMLGASFYAGLPFGVNASTPEVAQCSLVAEQEEGPFYIPDELIRSNIAEGKPGIPLVLTLSLVDARACKPLVGAAVDIWHCDSLGTYSGFTQSPSNDRDEKPPPDFDRAPGRPPDGPLPGRPPRANRPSDMLTFLRGIQISDSTGAVTFGTVFPGFYMGRTNHVHIKVRVRGEARGDRYEAGHTSHTGQIFFPEEFTAGLMKSAPYSEHLIHRVTLQQDHVFVGQSGSTSMADVQNKIPSDDNTLHARLAVSVDPGPSGSLAKRVR